MSEENAALIEINKAQQMLERANTIHEMMDLRDKFMALQLFANAQGFKEAAQEAKIYQLKAERKAGEWLEENVRAGNPQFRQDDGIGLLPDGVDENESRRWQLEAKVPEEQFNEWVDDCLATGKEITASGLRYIAKGDPHVMYNSGENEWFTPPEFIKAAREVMGEIDLDPASSDSANKIVRAKRFYTRKDDGLQQEWDGRVWMNPPYSGDLIGDFTSKLSSHYSMGDVLEAIVLVNNATETKWFLDLISVSSAVVFPIGRIRFLNDYGSLGAPLQGQALIYLGDNINKFLTVFSKFGWGAKVCKR